MIDIHVISHLISFFYDFDRLRMEVEAESLLNHHYNTLPVGGTYYSQSINMCYPSQFFYLS